MSARRTKQPDQENRSTDMGMMTTFRPALPAGMEANSLGRHVEWLAEYDAAFDFANEVGISESVRAQRCEPLSQIEQRVLETPARNAEEMRSKIRMAQRINQQGCALDENDSLRLLTESLNWFGGDAQPRARSRQMNKPTPSGAAAWAAAVAAYATARAAELAHYADVVAPACETDDMPARVAAEASYDKLVDATAAALAKAFETPAADFGGVLWKLARLAEDETGDQTRERVAAISADVRRLSARKPMAVGAITYSPILKTTAVCMAESYHKGDFTIEQLIFHLADIHNHATMSGEKDQQAA